MVNILLSNFAGTYPVGGLQLLCLNLGWGGVTIKM